MAFSGDKPKRIAYGTHPHNPTMISLGVTPLINPNLADSLPSPEDLIYLPKNEAHKRSYAELKSKEKRGGSSPGRVQESKSLNPLLLNYSNTAAIKQKQAAGYNIINKFEK